ncbi:MAG TPA: CpsD/CapB family tyrosine-protein kinase, partial [Terriglobia bacterium]|nr:CpsD/CapB family tyrosine-protein kinase [Terriglobia bacterium]
TLAFVQEALDYSVRSADEVEGLVGLPSLAVIPASGSVPARQYPLTKANSNGHRNGAVALTVLKNPTSALAESYRTLRTSILLSTAARPPQVLLLTSAHPGEGKTTTALNLSMALAQRGSRVLVVDADLRKPGVAAALGLPNDKGLSSVLTGAHSAEDALQRIEAAPSLWVLTSGPRPPNPAELLSSPSMADLLAELRTHFDHVVLDSPPSLLLTDATVLTTLADGVLLVVETGVTARGALIRARRTLQAAGGRLLGVVMNKADIRRDEGYGYYHYHRYYRSGYDYFSDNISPAPASSEETAPVSKVHG